MARGPVLRAIPPIKSKVILSPGEELMIASRSVPAPLSAALVTVRTAAEVFQHGPWTTPTRLTAVMMKVFKGFVLSIVTIAHKTVVSLLYRGKCQAKARGILRDYC